MNMKKPTTNRTHRAASTIPTDDCLISQKQTCQMLGGCSKMHLWRLVHDEGYRSLNFPRPIEIGKVGKHPRKFFRLGEIKAWIAKRAASIGAKAA
jgi:predicted DNA-binding transcriptional regulator AlpA